MTLKERLAAIDQDRADAMAGDPHAAMRLAGLIRLPAFHQPDEVTEAAAKALRDLAHECPDDIVVAVAKLYLSNGSIPRDETQPLVPTPSLRWAFKALREGWSSNSALPSEECASQIAAHVSTLTRATSMKKRNRGLYWFIRQAFDLDAGPLACLDALAGVPWAKVDTDLALLVFQQFNAHKMAAYRPPQPAEASNGSGQG